MKLFKRGPSKLERLIAVSRIQDAMERIEQQEPLRIYNPGGGTRCHYRDPDQAAARPVCNASGAGWAEGDGGLKLCGLCPGMWAQRQVDSEVAS